MDGTSYFESLSGRAKAHILQQAAGLDDLVPEMTGSFRFSTGEIRNREDIEALLNTLKRKLDARLTYLYFIQTVDALNVDEIVSAFGKAKGNSKSTRAFPRFNAENYETNSLYVGSSSNFIQRLKCHLGYGPASTYSLQLLHWASGLNLQLVLVYAGYPAGVNQEAVQLLEDTLWNELKPMFGREGKR